MAVLYIIGNGFDRWHDLPTSYVNDFGSLVEKKYPNEFALYVKLFFGSETEHEQDYWSRFEEKVGAVPDTVQEEIRYSAEDSLRWFIEEANSDGVTSDDRDFGMQADEHANAIASAVPSLERMYPELFDPAFEELRLTLDECMNEMVARANGLMTTCMRRGSFTCESYFISFNYTDTLEVVYSIPPDRVLHVHGRKSSGDALIWGNEASKIRDASIELSVPTDTLVDKEEPADYDSGDYGCFSGYTRQYETVQEELASIEETGRTAARLLEEACSGYVKQLNLQELEAFLRSVPDKIDEVVVLGHSLADVDLPYFKKMRDLFPQAMWSISYYKINEVKRIVRAGEELSMPSLLIGTIDRLAFRRG